MASRVVMPKLTDSMEEGVVVKWRKAEGDRVESGDVLAEIETDKAVMDLEAFASGTLRKILAAEGTTVPSGALIGVIAEPDEDIQELLKSPAPVPAATPEKTGPAKTERGQAKEPVTEGDVAASPRVRTLAREHNIELNKIKGSGPGGRVIERDLEPFLKEAKAQVLDKAAAKEVPLSQMRKAIVRITTQSKAPVPHFYVTIDADMDEGHRLVEESKKQSKRISLSHLITAAATRALAQHPGVNAAFAGETIKIFSQIDIGIAVALEEGLIVPVLRDCGGKTLQEIAEAQRALVARAQRRDLTPEEYTGATFLISNLGMYDIDSFIAVILPPAAAVLAVGSVREVPVIRKGKIEAGRRMKLTLSCDHRVIDGAVAGKFLETLKHGLEHAREL